MLNPKSLVLSLLAAPLAAGSAWLCAAVAKYGVHLDKSGVNALAVAGATGGLGLVLKLVHELEKKDPALFGQAAAVAKAVDKADPQLKGAVVAAGEAEAEKLAKMIDPGLSAPPRPAPVPPAPPAA